MADDVAFFVVSGDETAAPAACSRAAFLVVFLPYFSVVDDALPAASAVSLAAFLVVFLTFFSAVDAALLVASAASLAAFFVLFFTALAVSSAWKAGIARTTISAIKVIMRETNLRHVIIHPWDRISRPLSG